MNLENFTQAYKSVIAESQDDSDLKAYIRSIVEEVMKTFKNFISEALDPEQFQKYHSLLMKHHFEPLGVRNIYRLETNHAHRIQLQNNTFLHSDLSRYHEKWNPVTEKQKYPYDKLEDFLNKTDFSVKPYSDKAEDYYKD